MRFLMIAAILGLSLLQGQISTPAGCINPCRRQTVMFCQVPDGNIVISASDVAACRACLANAPECRAGAGVAAEITAPANGAELTADAVQFTWSAGINVDSYTFAVDTRPGGSSLASVGPTKVQAATVRMPNDEATIYVTLYSNVAGGGRLEKSY